VAAAINTDPKKISKIKNLGRRPHRRDGRARSAAGVNRRADVSLRDGRRRRSKKGRVSRDGPGGGADSALVRFGHAPRGSHRGRGRGAGPVPPPAEPVRPRRGPPERDRSPGQYKPAGAPDQFVFSRRTANRRGPPWSSIVTRRPRRRRSYYSYCAAATASSTPLKRYIIIVISYANYR